MGVLRLCCLLLTIYQLTELSCGMPVKSKKKSHTKVEKSKTKSEKAVYAHLYEDTKNDVNKAIENAILEASKKATDMVLEPKTQSHLVNQMADQISNEMDTAGSGAAKAVSSDNEQYLDKETALANSEITKKHTKARPAAKEATGIKVENIDDEEGKVVEDEEGSAEEPKKVLKARKVIKEYNPKENEDLNVVDATESSAAEPESSNAEDEEKNEAEDDDEPEEENKDEEGDNKVLPPITEAKNDAPMPIKTEAKGVPGPAGSEAGQEDLKQLLDESITNLIKANSAVEVLLRATNERIQAQHQQCVKDKKCKLYCYQTLPSEQAAVQFMTNPQCSRYNCCPPAI